MTYDFTQITEVRLAKGAHRSPQSGMCFMEMAAWFAGEEHSDNPQCACPVLGRYGIVLNDHMTNDERDRLLKPLVPLMVGTRDPDKEQERAEFLAMWAVNKILPIALRSAGLEEHAQACEAGAAADAAARAAAGAAARAAAGAAYAATRAAADAAARAAAADAARAAADAASCAASYAATRAAAAYAAGAASYAAARAATRAAAAYADVWPVAVEGLRQAILLGKHEGAIAFEERHTALREMVDAGSGQGFETQEIEG